MLERLASEPIAAWYRHLLAREESCRQRLVPFAGRSARYRLGMLSVAFTVQADGQIAAANAASESDALGVTVTLDPAALAQVPSDAAAMLRNMKVDGDVEFARVFTETLSRLKPDPAEDLSRWIGDAPAQRIIDLAAQALAAGREVAQRAAQQGSEYLTSETGVLVSRSEFERFRTEVQQLQQRIERAETAAAGAVRSAP